MGFFNFITKFQEKINDLQKRFSDITLDEPFLQRKKKEKPETPSTSKTPKQSGAPKQSRTAKQIIKRFYFNYPEIPYISNDRTSDWIERAELFPKQCIIPKSMLTRFSDGLLPGHVYMLYWLKRYTNKKVPAYFEYKYGIDFDKEKAYLLDHGYLDEINKPTKKGEEAINHHIAVIESHSAATAKPDCATQILALRDSLKKNGFKEYEFIANSDCCSVCGELNGKHFPVSKLKIGVNAPPMHEGCSCSIAAYSDREEYDQWLNSL